MLRKSVPFVTTGAFNLPWQKNLVINVISFTWKQYEHLKSGTKTPGLQTSQLQHPSSVLTKLHWQQWQFHLQESTKQSKHWSRGSAGTQDTLWLWWWRGKVSQMRGSEGCFPWKLLMWGDGLRSPWAGKAHLQLMGWKKGRSRSFD